MPSWPDDISRAWLYAAQLAALVGGLLVWALRDHRRRLRAERQGGPVDPPPPEPLLASDAFRSAMVAASSSERAFGNAWKGAGALFGSAALFVGIDGDAWPAALGMTVATLTWFACVRWLFAVPGSARAERVLGELVVRRPVRRLAGEVVVSAAWSIFVLGFAGCLAFYRVDPLSWRGALVAVVVAAFVPLGVFAGVQGEIRLGDAGVTKAHRWLPGRRTYPWRELTGLRLVGPELEEPPRLELLGFTNIARVVVPLEADGIGDLAAALLRHLPAGALAAPGMRALLEELARSDRRT